jgi:hypothetical protein
VIIITILKNSATTVKAFLTQKEESFHENVHLKVTATQNRAKKKAVLRKDRHQKERKKLKGY